MQNLATWIASNVRWLKQQLMSRGRSCEDAEDLIQEAYLRVHEHCEHGGVAREPEKVLVRTVIRLSINERRNRRQHLYVDSAVEELALIDPAPPAEEVLTMQKTMQCILQTLESVEPRTREAFLLHRMEGLTYGQIARRFGVSVSNIEKRVAWAMAVVMDAAAREGISP